MPKRNGAAIALLADETRRAIIALLAQRPHRASAIARGIGRSRPATSRQLRILREAGLVKATRSRIDRRAVVYAIDVQVLGRIAAWLAGTEVGFPDDPVQEHERQDAEADPRHGGGA